MLTSLFGLIVRRFFGYKKPEVVAQVLRNCVGSKPKNVRVTPFAVRPYGTPLYWAVSVQRADGIHVQIPGLGQVRSKRLADRYTEWLCADLRAV